MKCTKCGKPGVHKLPNMILCKDHFITYFEQKVTKTIRKYRLFSEGKKVCVATSGGKDSLAVLYMTRQYCQKYNIPFFALAIDEGIKDYRDHTLEDLKEFCNNYDISLKIVSFDKVFGKPLDEIVEAAKTQYNKKPCTVCGILRRTLLNLASKKYGAEILVTGHNLDDESQAYMMNLFLGNMGHNASLGPISGLQKTDHFVPRVKPLYFMSEKETRIFAFLKGFKVSFSECPNISYSFRAEVRNHLNSMEDIRDGIKNGIVNSFLEILPELKKKYKQERSYGICERCNNPSSGKVCNTCQLIKELNLTWNLEQL